MTNAIMLDVIASEIAVSENQTHFSALFPLNWFQKQLVILGLGLRRKGENAFSAKLFSKSAISYFSRIEPKEMSEIENAETTFRETKKFIFYQHFKQLT